MLIEIAIADAYGAGYEFVSAEERRDRPNELQRYYPHPRATHCGGRYTDDTQMSVALAEAILDPDEPWNADSVADRFVRAYRRDPRAGYSSRMRTALERATDGEGLRAELDARKASCGAAMRSVPLGCLPDDDAVRARAELQASVTHDTEQGRASSVAVALASRFLRRGGAIAGLDAHLEGRGVDATLLAPWSLREPVPNDAIACVRAAFTCLRGAGSLSECLRAAVTYLGDVDSVAAIAVGLGSQTEALAHDLPGALHDGLERGPYGYAYLVEIDARLRGLP